MTAITGHVIKSKAEIPLHLRDRVPFSLPNTEVIFRRPEEDVLADDGSVRMTGAIEFQTQITPGRLTDVCEPDEMYKPEMKLTHRFRVVYDPEIQRGVKDSQTGPKEFLRETQIESMMEDIMENRFECPQLMWNLRDSETVWVYVRDEKALHIYEGVATRPDTNHRHHAIVRMHRRFLAWVRDTGSTNWGTYNPHRAYGLVIYTDSVQGEGHRFYIYNFKGWRVSTSTAHYIEAKTADPQVHTRLARELMEASGILGVKNVEVLNNQLSRNSAKIITFGTLVEALKSAFPSLTEDIYENVRTFLLKFLDELSQVRPNEIALLSVAQRQQAREATVADQAVLWHAYFRVAARLREVGLEWPSYLTKLNSTIEYQDDDGELHQRDVMSRNNPIWLEKGVIAPGKKGPRVVNNRQARTGAFEYLRDLLQLPDPSAAVTVAA